jgi:hypothetical protein
LFTTPKLPAQKVGGRYKRPAKWRHGFVEASPSRVLRDGEGIFRVTVIDVSQVLEMGSDLKYIGNSERISE